jgi:exopolysaccharide biosynthesis polyprenyl glycosylphosphotransferase
MLKEHATMFRQLMMLTDMTLVFMVYILTLVVTGLPRSYDIKTYILFAGLIVMLWGLMLNHFGMYNSLRSKDISEVIAIVLKSTVLGYLLFGGLTYMLRLPILDTRLATLTFLICGWALCLEKIALMLFLKNMRQQGFNYRSILIVGTGPRAQRFLRLLQQHKEWGFKIFGLVDPDPQKTGQSVDYFPVIGVLEDIPRILQQNVVDEVVFVIPRKWLNTIEESIHFCESQGIKVHLALDIFNLKLSRMKQSDLDGFPLLTFESTPDKVWLLLIKRIFDITVSLTGLLLLSPLFIMIGILIKTTSPGPIFYQQQRVGLNGRRFILHKFRTMQVGAEAKLKDLLIYNEMTGAAFKMKNDPRVTMIGRFLRGFSLDELPQLWDVLVGNMSIVGPRPPLPDEVNQFKPWQRRKLSMRPGITCLWQAGGRNKITDFDEWMKLDLQYIDNWSLWLDFKLIFKTIPAVLLRIGAK